MNNADILEKIKNTITLSYDDPAIISTIYHLPYNSMMDYYVYQVNIDVNIHVNILIKLILLSKEYPLLLHDIENILLHKLVDVNWQNNDGSTALMFAVQLAGQILALEIIDILLKYGADVNIKNNLVKCNMALLYTIYRYPITPIIIQKLLARGADINGRNNNNNTLLMMFINEAKYYDRHEDSMSEFLQFIKFLLDNGANVNMQNNSGETAIMLIIQYINNIESSNNFILKIMKILLKRGIYIDNIDHTTLRYTFKHIQLITILPPIIELCLKYDTHNVDIADAQILLMIESNDLSSLINKYYNIQYKYRTLQHKCLIIAKLHNTLNINLNNNLNNIPQIIIDSLCDKAYIDWTVKFDLYRINQIISLREQLKIQEKFILSSEQQLVNGSYNSMI